MHLRLHFLTFSSFNGRQDLSVGRYREPFTAQRERGTNIISYSPITFSFSGNNSGRLLWIMRNRPRSWRSSLNLMTMSPTSYLVFSIQIPPCRFSILISCSKVWTTNISVKGTSDFATQKTPFLRACQVIWFSCSKSLNWARCKVITFNIFLIAIESQ